MLTCNGKEAGAGAQKMYYRKSVSKPPHGSQEPQLKTDSLLNESLALQNSCIRPGANMLSSKLSHC